MYKEQRYITWLKWIVVLILFLGFFNYSLDFFHVKDLKPDTIQGKVIMNIGIFLMIFVAIGAHELGHLLMGLKHGFRFELFVVGLLGVKRKDNSIEFYLNKNLAYFGGVASTLPVDENEDNARKFGQVLLAGPISSLLFTLLCFLSIPFVNGYFGVVIYTGGMVSLWLFLATTVPSRTGMFFTDRKRYQRLVKPGRAQEVELAILKIMGRYSRDNSYKNIDKNNLTILIEDELPFFQFYGLFSLICHQLETDGVAEEKVLEDYRRISIEMSKNVVASFDKEIEALR